MSKPWLLSTVEVSDSYIDESLVLDLVSDLKARGYQIRNCSDEPIPRNWNPRRDVVQSADVLYIYNGSEQVGRLGRIFKWARSDPWYNQDFPVLEKVGDVTVVEVEFDGKESPKRFLSRSRP